MVRLKVRNILLIISVLIFLTACASVPTQKRPIENHRDFNKPFNYVWNRTVEGLVRSGKIISYTDKANGLITIEEKIAGDDVPKLVSNPGFLTIYRRGRSKTSIYIKPLSRNRTRVFANIEISAIGTPFLSNKPQEIIGLKSNGTIEKNYLDLIAKMIKLIRSPIISPEPAIEVKKPTSMEVTKPTSMEMEKPTSIEVTKPTSMVVVKPTANIREGPTTHSKIITTLQQGAAITMIGKKGKWVRIELPDREIGWVYRTLVGPESAISASPKEKKTEGKALRSSVMMITVIRSCEVKKGPGPFYPTLKEVAPGTRLRATGNKQEDWIEVEVGNEKGYVYKDFVR